MAPRTPGSRGDLVTRGLAALWLLAVPALAVGALLWLGQLPEPFTGEIVGSSVSEADDGFAGDVRWVDGDGVRRVGSFTLTGEQVASGTVLLVDPENQLRVFDPSLDKGPSALTLAVTAGIGLLFAVVVLAAVRGYGFVRGTGRPGEMAPDEVEESRGFYWRH